MYYKTKHRKSFKLDLQRERDKSRITRDKPGGSTPMFEGRCSSEVLWSTVSMEVGDGEPRGSKDGRVMDVLETTEAPENGRVGIRVFPPRKVVGSIAQLKCIYTNAHSMGSKQEEPLCSRKTMT